jgi:hypothetical protein
MIETHEIGLIINPKAGQGYSANARVAQEIITRLKPRKIFTGSGELGSDAVSDLGIPVVVCAAPPEPGRAQTQALAARLIKNGISSLVVIGGDGTMADVACILAESQDAPPLLGIGVGSTNVGNLITCRAHEIEQLYADRLQARPLRALLAYHNGKLSGIGFNDCVLGFTVVGTIDDTKRDVDAASKMNGLNIPGTIRSIGLTQTIVERQGPDGVRKIASGRKVATVIIGFAESAFFGKAVTGGVCLSSLVKAPAGCLTANQPLVQIEIDRQTVLSLPPITSSYLSLDETMIVRVQGVRQGTALCVDGNPLKLLEPDDTAEFGVSMDAILAFRIKP